LGIVVVRPEASFPGFWALLPVAGVALLINAGCMTGLNRRVLSLRPVVWLGLISYPLYLWH
jgi:peptidoglycan/LPS O-acetylase OafA/YrhL